MLPAPSLCAAVVATLGSTAVTIFYVLNGGPFAAVAVCDATTAGQRFAAGNKNKKAPIKLGLQQ